MLNLSIDLSNPMTPTINPQSPTSPTTTTSAFLFQICNSKVDPPHPTTPSTTTTSGGFAISKGHKIRRALKAKKILKKALQPSKGGGSGGGVVVKKAKALTGRTVELHVTEGSRLGSQLVYPADDTGEGGERQ